MTCGNTDRNRIVDTDPFRLYKHLRIKSSRSATTAINLTMTRLEQIMIKQVASWWVMLFVLMNGTSAYANTSPQVKITRVVMPDIKMEGQQVVQGVNYPISISYETQCGKVSCNNQKIRLGVSNWPPPIIGSCATNEHPWAYDPWDLRASFANFQVDYQLGNPSLMHNFGEWAAYTSLPDHTFNSMGATITLRKIKKKPKLSIYVWAEYNLNNLWCMDHKEVTVGTETVDQVQVSGLKDQTLSPEGEASLDSVCVYSSTGWASLRFDGSNSGSGQFQLRQTPTASHHAIPYQITITSDYGQTGLIGKDGHAQHRGGNRWQVSEVTGCNGPGEGGANMTFDIKANLGKEIPHGRYSDRMTVIVAPL